MKNGMMLFTLVGMILLIAGLSGCGKNPMLNKKYVMAMRANRFLEDPVNFPIRECAKYYAGNGNSALLSKCDKWSKDYYTSLQANGSIDPAITLQEFRAKDFWVEVESA